jgi:hypothetical protein
MSVLKMMLLVLGAMLLGCAATPRETKSAGPDIAAEVARICALPKGERDKALERLKQDSGMVLFCGSKE